MMYKVKHGLAPIYITKLFHAKNTQYYFNGATMISNYQNLNLFDMVDTLYNTWVLSFGPSYPEN